MTAGAPGREALAPFVAKFRRDYEGHYTVFVAMRFVQTLIHRTLFSCVRSELAGLGVTAVRADDRSYTDGLWSNVETYLLGVNAGIVVFDNALVDGHRPLGINPNVSVELGYLMGLGKPWLILEDRHIEEMPIDLRGLATARFDGNDPEPDVRRAVRAWATSLPGLP